MDNVDLIFEEEAIGEIAQKALDRKTGARGLRAIFEEIMTNVMYDIPSREDVDKCIIKKETVIEKLEPEIILLEPGAKKPAKKPTRKSQKAKRGTAS
jgi:ATP-dependent Clp protease ATP-binding subunit ClpX